MASPPNEKLTRREREIMDAIFALGNRASAEEVQERLSDPPSYSAVRAMLVKLEAKGYVRHREEGMRYIYSPTTSRAAAQRNAIHQLVHVFFGGSSSHTATALLKQENWTDDELDALRAEIDQVRKRQEAIVTYTIFESALALSRWVELSTLLKATILLMLGLVAARLAGHARASVRHLLLAATFATLLALPMIVFTAPGVVIEIPVSRSIVAPQAQSSPDVQAPSANSTASPALESSRWTPPSWPTIFRWGWIAGALLLLAPLALDLWRRRPIRRDGLPCPKLHVLTQSLAAECGINRSVEVLLHEDIAAPLTFGLWHPAIVLPSDAPEWSRDDLHRALVHELEHVRRGDWAIQLAARAACALYWFHPLVWMAWRRLCLEAERACDDAVIVSQQPTEYAGQLVLLARRLSKPHTQPALGMANRSDLSTRVSALLDHSQRRGRVGLLAGACTIAAASLLVLAIAPVRAVAQSDRRPAPLDRVLYDAAESGSLDAIAASLNAGANVNCTLPGDGTPLIGAARRGHLAAVRLLLDRGADPNLPVRGDGNPLIMAARGGHVDVVTLLLDRGALVDEMVPEDENALIQASGKGRLDVVKLLVARRANVNARAWAESTSERPDGEWRTPLRMARKGGHEAVVAFLLASGARE